MEFKDNLLRSITIFLVFFIGIFFIGIELVNAQGNFQYFPYPNLSSNWNWDYLQTQDMRFGAVSSYPFNSQTSGNLGEMYPNPDFKVLSVDYFSRNSQQQMNFNTEGEQVMRRAHSTLSSVYMPIQDEWSFNMPGVMGPAIQTGNSLWPEWQSSLLMSPSFPLSFNQGSGYNMPQWQNQMPSYMQPSFTTWEQPAWGVPMPFSSFQFNTPSPFWMYR